MNKRANEFLLAIEPNWLNENLERVAKHDAPFSASWFDDEASASAYEKRGSVAVIRCEGVMEKRLSFWSWLFGGCSTEMLQAALGQAENDPTVNAIVMVFDSPGGQVAGTDDLAQVVRRVDAKKPVVGYVSDMCCSAAYWIASQCREVSANSTALIGSIGVLHVVRDTSAMAERMGIKVEAIGSSKHKGAGTPGTPITDEHKAEFQRIVDSLYSQFRSAVQSGRKLSEEQTNAVADARLWVAPDAVENKLVNRIASLDDTVSRAAQLALQPSRKQTSASGLPDRKASVMKITLKDLLARFRAAGVPEETIAQVATEDIEMADAKPAAEADLTQNPTIKALLEQNAALAGQVTALNSQVTTQKSEAQYEKDCAFLEGLVRQMKLTPAEATRWKEKAKANPDAFAAAKDVLAETPVRREIAREGLKVKMANASDPANQITALAKQRAAEQKISFSEASRQIIAENPALAQAHADNTPVVAQGGKE